VLETTVAVGAKAATRTHRWPSVKYVLIATNFVRRDGDGSVAFDTRTANAEPQRPDIL
jgi:hypothetical protein